MGAKSIRFTLSQWTQHLFTLYATSIHLGNNIYKTHIVTLDAESIYLVSKIYKTLNLKTTIGYTDQAQIKSPRHFLIKTHNIRY